MPHFVIEYTATLEQDVHIQKLVDDIFAVAIDSALFTPDTIKVRATPCQAHTTGGVHKPFIHVNVKLFSGRTTEQKKALTQAVFDCLIPALSDNVALSIETSDIEIDTYTKRD